MTPATISLIVSCVGAAFLLFGVFWGMIRGFKKSLFRGLWLLGLALIVFFLTPVISRALCNMDISGLNIKIDGETVNSVYGILEILLLSQEEIADFMVGNPSLLPLIQQVIVLFINVFVFPIAYWVAKIITYPIWAILAMIFIKRKQRAQMNGKKVVYKAKKYRWAGMGIGLVSGILVMVVTMMPISGTINLLKDIDTLEYSGSENGEGVVTSVLGEEAMEYMDSYSDSVLGKALKYTGITFISDSMYEFLSTKKIDDQKVTLSNELKVYLQLYNDIETIQNTDFDNLTKDSMSKFLNSAEGVVKKLFSSSLLKIAGKDLIPYAVGVIEKNESFNNNVNGIETEEMKQLALESLDKFKQTSVNDLQQDLLNVIYVAKALNDGDILVPAINDELSDDDYIDLFNDNVVNQVSQYLFKMPSVKKIYPIAMDKLFTFAARELKFEYTSKTFENDIQNQTDFANVVKGALGVIRTLDNESDYKVTNLSFEATGKFLDVLKNTDLMNQGVFGNLLGALFDKGKEEINKSGDMSTNLKDMVGTIIDKVENMVVNKNVILATEFRQYGVLFDDVKAIVDEFKSTDKKSLKLDKYGTLLDNLNETNILIDIVPDIVDTGWNEIRGDFVEATKDFPELEDVIHQIVDNIVLILENQHKEDKEITSGQNPDLSLKKELTQVQGFYDFVINNLLTYFEDNGTGADGIKEDLFGEASTLSDDLGVTLQNLNNNLVFTPKVIRHMMAAIFSGIKDDLGADERIQNFVDDIIYNMKNNNVNPDWRAELAHIKRLANLDSTGFDIDSVGALLDDVYNSMFIGKDMVNDLIKEEIMKEYDALSDDVKNDTTEAIINRIAGDGGNIDKLNGGSYEIEINHMLNMMDLVEGMSTMEYSQIGPKLDEFHTSYTISNVRNMMIEYAIDKKLEEETEGSIVYKVLLEIKGNIAVCEPGTNASFYTTQFNGINSIMDLTYPANKDELTNEMLSTLGDKFFEISDQKVHVLIYKLGELVYGEILDQAGDSMSELNTAITSIKNGVTADTGNSEYNGILVNNRKVTGANAEAVAATKAVYVACFTDLYSLISIYEDVDAVQVDENTDASVIGGHLDQVTNLSIITNEEDKIIAKIILDKFEDIILDKLAAKANTKIEEIQNVPEEKLDNEHKMALIDEVDEIEATYVANLTNIISTTEDTIDAKTSAESYTTIFGSLITGIKSTLENTDQAISNIILPTA